MRHRDRRPAVRRSRRRGSRVRRPHPSKRAWHARRDGVLPPSSSQTRTLANLTDWPEAKVEALRRVLRGETLVVAADRFAIERSLPHGHVAAVLGTLRRIGLDRLLPRRPERLATLALALIVGPRGRAGGEAGHRPPAERGDGFAFAGRGAGAGRGGRGRALPCPRSVGRGAAGDRDGRWRGAI